MYFNMSSRTNTAPWREGGMEGEGWMERGGRGGEGREGERGGRRRGGGGLGAKRRERCSLPFPMDRREGRPLYTLGLTSEEESM